MTYVMYFFIKHTATTLIYTLSLHDALPISGAGMPGGARSAHGARRPGRAPTRAAARPAGADGAGCCAKYPPADRKSTRLNSSHMSISYAVFCLKKKTITHYSF